MLDFHNKTPGAVFKHAGGSCRQNRTVSRCVQTMNLDPMVGFDDTPDPVNFCFGNGCIICFNCYKLLLSLKPRLNYVAVKSAL